MLIYPEHTSKVFVPASSKPAKSLTTISDDPIAIVMQLVVKRLISMPAFVAQICSQ